MKEKNNFVEDHAKKAGVDLKKPVDEIAEMVEKTVSGEFIGEPECVGEFFERPPDVPVTKNMPSHGLTPKKCKDIAENGLGIDIDKEHQKIKDAFNEDRLAKMADNLDPPFKMRYKLEVTYGDFKKGDAGGDGLSDALVVIPIRMDEDEQPSIIQYFSKDGTHPSHTEVSLQKMVQVLQTVAMDLLKKDSRVPSLSKLQRISLTNFVTEAVMMEPRIT